MHETGFIIARRMRWERVTAWMTGAIIVAGIALSALVSLELLSGLVELCCVVIACSLFSVTWHSRGFSDAPFFLFVGTGALGIGCLWLLHSLVRMGMLNMVGNADQISLFLQIEARLLEAGMLFAAPFFVGRSPRASLMLAGSVLVTAAAIALALLFPGGAGVRHDLAELLPVSGLLACALLVGAMILLGIKRNGFDKRVFALLLVSIAAKVATELSSSFGAVSSPLLSVTGAFFRLTSAFILFRAVVSTALEDPYRLLFHGMHHAQSEASVEDDKVLSGIVSICMSCKKIRVSDESWEQIETYISAHSHLEFSHGICPDCAQKVFSEMAHDGTV